MPQRVIFPTILVLVVLVIGGFYVFFNGKKPNKPIGQLNPMPAQAFILPISEPNYLPVRNFNIPEPELTAKAVGLYDVNSGRFLYAKNINQKLPIASITKLMTAIVVMENFSLTENYSVAVEDINVDGKGADLYRGEEIKGSNLFKMMLIKSSNDAALTFATQARRRGINLIAKMNEKAQTIGLINTRFADPAGLDDGDAFSTVSDLVKLVRYVGRYPVIWEILTTKTADIVSADGRFSHHLINTNKLLDQLNNIIGGKTGYTDAALETMVLEVAVNGGRERLISVVLGSADRFGETKKLIDWGLNAYRWK